MTEAEKVSKLFNDDGMNFIAKDGVEHLDEACQRHGGVHEYHPDVDKFYTERFEFEDGSAIVISGDAWDLEGTEPFSWKGEG